MSLPHHESGVFRFVIGLIALGGAMGGFFSLFFIEIPARNENALLLALGFVMGWAGAVIASEYGSTATGRKVAESAIRKIERQDIATQASPTGTADDPVSVEGAAAGTKPVQIRSTKP